MEVFEQIYLEYSARVYHFLYKLSGDPAEAEELTQETFYRALKGFDKFRGECGVYTWLAAIAKRTYFASVKNRKQGLEAIDLNAVIDSFCASQASAEEVVVRESVRQHVRELMYELPKKYRDVVLLRVYADLSFSQIAKAVGITENSAKVLYFRAKKMLRERLIP